MYQHENLLGENANNINQVHGFTTGSVMQMACNCSGCNKQLEVNLDIMQQLAEQFQHSNNRKKSRRRDCKSKAVLIRSNPI